MIRHLHSRNATAGSPLDVLCATETIREIFDAMTPKQLVVAALLFDEMPTWEIADALEVTFEAVAYHRRMAQRRVVSALYHGNAEELAGDVYSRTWKAQKTMTAEYRKRQKEATA